MKKLIFAILSLSVFLFSCEKIDFKKEFENEISTEDVQFRLPQSSYEITKPVPLEKEENSDFYTSGVIEYVKDGVVLGSFNYGNGENDEKGEKDVDGIKEEIALKKEEASSKYEKVIIEPLVKSDDCDYIISGIIKYYETASWTATVDFGDGTCDDLATKYTDDGETYIFNISEYY